MHGGPYGQLRVYEQLSGIEMTHGRMRDDFLKDPKISPKIIFPEDVDHGVKD